MLENVENLDPKSGLVTEICAASEGCAHRYAGSGEIGFVDWYLILRVDEDADSDVIKKHYFKLALQLHPDKNNHPNAEIAFKLISQAYTCLSDASKRKAFELDRRKHSCLVCNNIVNKSSHSLGTKFKGFKLNSLDKSSKSSKFWRGWMEVRERFKTETSIIENCLKSNNNVPKKEYPVFRPSEGSMYKDYFHWERGLKESPVFNPVKEESNMFQTYPTMERVRSSKSWYSEKRSGWREVGRRMGETPVFEVKHDMNKLHRSKSAACVHPLWKAT